MIKSVHKKISVLVTKTTTQAHCPKAWFYMNHRVGMQTIPAKFEVLHYTSELEEI